MKLEDREGLIVHIEGLQATLAKRNVRIAELEEQLRNPSALTEKAEGLAFQRGWEACSGHLMQITFDLARELGKVRKEAFRVYLDYDRAAQEAP